MHRLYTFLARLLKVYPALTISTVVLMMVATFFDVLIIALIIPILQTFLGNSETNTVFMRHAQILIENFFNLLHIPETFATGLLFIALLFILQGAIRFFQIKLQLELTRRYEHRLVHKLFTQYINARWSFFLNNKIGHLANVLTVEIERTASALDHAFKFLSNFFITAVYLVLSFLFSWQLTFAGIVMAIVVSLVLRIFVQKAQKFGKVTTEINNQFHSTALDLLLVIKMIKSSASQKYSIKLIDRLIEKKTTLRYRTQLYTSFIPSFYISMIMVILIVLIYISTTVLHIPFATILIFVYIVYRLIPTLSSMQFSYHQALIFLPGYEEVQRLLMETKNIQEPKSGSTFTKPPTNIMFKSVYFAYDDGRTVLNNINFTISPGQSVAFIGSSGAGKTTILDLLLGLHTPTKGTIYIDEKPLTDYKLSEWRSYIGYLSQDIFLINDTIRTNITWGQEGIRDYEIQQALEKARADQFVAQMTGGLDTIIGDRGVKLSGGQKQRIALARIILQKPHIIILDEAINALDPVSANAVLDAIEKLFLGKICIFISHEIEYLQTVKNIYVLKNGTIIEHGSWSELNQNKSAFEKFKNHYET